MSVSNANVTPMMAQYLSIKDAHKDALLFYRMGDFYEMFFEDAVLASEALDIALTKRGKHQGRDIPMCGVPAHSSEGYLLSLIKKGFRVAVCEQLEDPAAAKKRGAKSVVKRDVVRLVTPGTLTEEALLDARKHNYLAAFSDVRGETALAWADMSTGDFYVTKCPHAALAPQLARLAPSEILISQTLPNDRHDLLAETGAAIAPLPRSAFDSDGARGRLTSLYGVSSLDAFGQFSRAERSAMGAIVAYLDLTQKGNLPLLRPPVQEAHETVMQIDAATRRNLEVSQSLSGARSGTLLAAIDRTVTGAGARLLERRLHSPSLVIDTIKNRQQSVAFMKENASLCDDIRGELRKMPDLDRSLSRLALGRGGPRDLGAIRTGLLQVSVFHRLLNLPDLPPDIHENLTALGGFATLAAHLERALSNDLPLLVRDGGVVAPEFDDELDDMRRLRDEGRGVIATYQAEYTKITGINSLKIKHNNVLGYFIETPSSYAERMLAAPLSDTFIHRQTTASAVRFTTVALSELETKILNSGGRALAIEQRIFEELRQQVVENATKISHAARALAEIDVTAGLADLARAEGWCRPIIEQSRRFEIVDGRHPVVEAALKGSGSGPFVENSCDLTPFDNQKARIWLLTGPNMAGKSTFLRQNALIALLAQVGSFVPATSAIIGLVTQLFSRVGASDDLARGRSTFMVEMVETAAILNQAGPGALVILDEIGRGTATYDGLSIAWATLENLHNVNKCRTLFATHYHELTALSSKLDGMTNATVTVREWEGDVIFLHEVREGAADRSYGVQVARLAGLPDAVIHRARDVLDLLERGDREGASKAKTLIDDLPLFSLPPQSQPMKSTNSALEKALTGISPDDLSPKEALETLYHLKGLLAKTP